MRSGFDLTGMDGAVFAAGPVLGALLILVLVVLIRLPRGAVMEVAR